MRIALENIRLQDAQKIAQWKSDRELSRWIMSNYQPIDTEQAVSWIQSNTADENQRLYGIYDLSCNQTVLGIVRLMFIDWETRSAELGIYIGEESYRGKGIGKRSIKMVLDRAFDELGLNKVYLKVRKDNESAVVLYQKTGFQIEGLLKEHFYENGNFQGNDVLYMAIFKQDFK